MAQKVMARLMFGGAMGNNSLVGDGIIKIKSALPIKGSNIMKTLEKCLFCRGNISSEKIFDTKVITCDCPRCGKYGLSHQVFGAYTRDPQNILKWASIYKDAYLRIIEQKKFEGKILLIELKDIDK